MRLNDVWKLGVGGVFFNGFLKNEIELEDTAGTWIDVPGFPVFNATAGIYMIYSRFEYIMDQVNTPGDFSLGWWKADENPFYSDFQDDGTNFAPTTDWSVSNYGTIIQHMRAIPKCSVKLKARIGAPGGIPVRLRNVRYVAHLMGEAPEIVTSH